MAMPDRNWADRIGRRLPLRDLHVFLAVAQWGSMAKAAEHLSISQPAVSRAVADLEAALAVRLLDRGPRGVEPTAWGRVLIRRGELVFDELRACVQELRTLSQPEGGEIRIGSPESMAAGLLPAAIERFSREHPQMVLQVAQAQTVTLEFRELRERRVDLMLGRISRPFSEDDLSAEILFEEKLYVVAGVQSRWARRRKIPLRELVAGRWILTPSENVIGALVSEAFRQRGLDPPRAAVVSFSFHLRNHLLGSGDFLTVIPGSMLRFFNSRRLLLKALPVDVEFEPQPVAMVTLKHRTPAPPVRLFMDALRDTVSELER